MSPHGTMPSYRAGCRCEACKAANAAMCAKARAVRTANGLTPDDERHGRPTTYANWGCRCQRCGEAHMAKMERDRARRSSPTVPPVAHGKNGYRGFGCRCADCVTGEAAYTAGARRAEWGIPHHHQQWTGPEMELAARLDLTARQVAEMIGRTPSAVATMRHRMRINPRDSRLAGVARSTGEPS